MRAHRRGAVVNRVSASWSRLRGFIRHLPGQVALYLGLLVLGSMLLVGTGVVLLLNLLPRAERRRSVRWLISAVFDWYLGLMGWVGLMQIDVSELDALRADRSLVIAPNHPCLLDALLVISRLPNATCIMKSELLDNILLGAGARAAGYIRNDCTRSMVRLAVEDIQRDGHLVVFPEGTRTVQQPVNPLRGAFAVIARRARVPIQVVFIETNSPFLGKGWPLWRRPQFPLRYRVRLGPRLQPGGSTDEIVATVAQCFENELGAAPRRRREVTATLGSTVDA